MIGQVGLAEYNGVSGILLVKQCLLEFIWCKLHTAFPDIHFTVKDMIDDGDKVASRISANKQA
jgi:hypothetical protein